MLSSSSNQSSAAAGNLERLMVLLDYSEGVLARVYNAIHHQCNEKTYEIPNSLKSHLLRKVNDPTDGIHALTESTYFHQNQDILLNENAFVFDVFADVLTFVNECLSIFKSITNTVVEFNLETTADISSRTLNLACNVVKIIVMTSKMNDDARIAALAYTLVNPTHSEAHCVIQLLHNSREPYEYLRSLLPPTLVISFKTCISQALPFFQIWTNYHALSGYKLFDLMDGQKNPNKLSIPTKFALLNEDRSKELKSSQDNSNNNHNKNNNNNNNNNRNQNTNKTINKEKGIIKLLDYAQYLDSIHDWIFSFVYVFCEQLNDAKMIEALTLLFQDRHHLIIYRDYSIDIKEELTKSLKFKQLMFNNNVNSNNNNHNATGQDELNWKEFYKSTRIDWNTESVMQHNHKQIQELLLFGLKDLVSVLNELPGVLAVKLPLIIAVLHKVRHEVLWSVVACKHVSGILKNLNILTVANQQTIRKFWKEFDHISELLYYTNYLMKMLNSENYETIVHDYYNDILLIDIEKFNNFYQNFDKHAFDGSTMKAIDGIYEQLNKIELKLKNENQIRKSLHNINEIRRSITKAARSEGSNAHVILDESKTSDFSNGDNNNDNRSSVNYYGARISNNNDDSYDDDQWKKQVNFGFTDKFESICVAYYRIQHDLSTIMHSMSAKANHKAAKNILLGCLKEICDDSKYMGDIESEINKFNIFVDLAFWQDSILEQLFIETISDTNKSIPPYNNVTNSTAAAAAIANSNNPNQADSQCVDTTRNVQRYVEVFFKINECYLLNLHDSFNDEREILGRSAFEFCERYLQLLCQSIQQCLGSITNEYVKLRKQVNSATIASKLIRINTGRYSGGGNYGNNNDGGLDDDLLFVTNGKLRMAGTESIYNLSKHESAPSYDASLIKLNANIHKLNDLIKFFRDNNELIIFDQKLFPNSYLYNEIENYFYFMIAAAFGKNVKLNPKNFKNSYHLDYEANHLFNNNNSRSRNSSTTNNGSSDNDDGSGIAAGIQGEEYYREVINSYGNHGYETYFMSPIELENYFQCLLFSMNRIDNILDLNVKKIIKSVLYREFYVPDILRRQSRVVSIVSSDEHRSPDYSNQLIHVICDFYRNIIEQTYPNNLKAIYSPLTQSWYSLYHHQTWARHKLPYENYCGVQEFESLCKIIGPHGARTLDYELLKMLVSSIAVIKRHCVQNKELVDKLCEVGIRQQSQLTYLTQNKDTVKLLRVVTQHGIRIGSILVMRELLRQALVSVCKQTSPFMVETIELTERATHSVMNSQNPSMQNENSKTREEIRHLTNMVSQYGLDDSQTQLIEELIPRFINNDNDKIICAQLPFLMSLSMLSLDYWKDCKYNANLGNFTNNGFVLAHAVNTLFNVFGSNGIDTNKLRSRKLFYLDIVSTICLMVNQTNPIVKIDHASNLLLYCEYFVSICQELQLSDLQTLGIFDMIRCEYVKVFSIASGNYTDSKLYNQTSVYDTNPAQLLSSSNTKHSNTNSYRKSKIMPHKKSTSEPLLDTLSPAVTTVKDSLLDS